MVKVSPRGSRSSHTQLLRRSQLWHMLHNQLLLTAFTQTTTATTDNYNGYIISTLSTFTKKYLKNVSITNLSTTLKSTRLFFNSILGLEKDIQLLKLEPKSQIRLGKPSTIIYTHVAFS